MAERSLRKMSAPVALPTAVAQIEGRVVALGKFDALHAGHRRLADAAAALGPPCMLSFAGMVSFGLKTC